MPVSDASLGQVVKADIDGYLVAGKDADVVHPHLAGDMGEDLVVILKPDAEHRVGQGVDDLALNLDFFFLGHIENCPAPLQRPSVSTSEPVAVTAIVCS